MNTRTVTLHGDQLAYEFRAGTGIPVLLVHGLGGSTLTWTDVTERLHKAGRTVLAVDLLGHGHSSSGNGDFSLGANASCIRDLLEHLGIEQVHIVGHSLGGGVALQFQYQFPQRVRSMTLISSGGLGTEVSFGLRAASLPGSEVVFRAITTDRVLGWLHRGVLSDRAAEKMRRLQDDRRRQAFLATVRSVIGPQGQMVSAVDKFGAVRDPAAVLILWGETDAVIPIEHGRSAHKRLPGSQFAVVPGAGHHPHEDEPDLVGEWILRHALAIERA